MIIKRFQQTAQIRFSNWKFTRVLAITFLLITLGLTTACAPKYATRGNLPSESKLSQIVVGIHNKNDVRKVLGAPSTVGTFEDDIWYYIGKNTTQTAFFREKVIEHKVVAVIYNKLGTVKHLKMFDKEDLKNITLVKRTTPTAGHSLGFLEQFLGNIGRFAK